MSPRLRGKTHDSGSTYAVDGIASVMLCVADSDECSSDIPSWEQETSEMIARRSTLFSGLWRSRATASPSPAYKRAVPGTLIGRPVGIFAGWQLTGCVTV